MNNIVIEKISGFILLFIGLLIIGSSLHQGMNIYVYAEEPPEIFKPLAAAVDPAATASKNPNTSIPKNLNEINPNDIQRMLSGNAISPEMIKSIIPPELFSYTSRMMNLTVFSLFLWVLITAGAKVSALGISLIKINSNIKV